MLVINHRKVFLNYCNLYFNCLGEGHRFNLPVNDCKVFTLINSSYFNYFYFTLTFMQLPINLALFLS